MGVTLFDLVPAKGGCIFSPAVARTRLALESKGVSFDTVELTYEQLSDPEYTKEYRQALGLSEKDLLTVPFIKKENGKYLMDSTVIARWLDRKFTDKPSIFTPETHPYDVESDEYKQALKALEPFRAALGKVQKPIFYLYAPTLVEAMESGSSDYFVSEARMGQGEWDKVLKQHSDKDKQVQEARQALLPFDALLAEEGREWLASPKTPGWQDFMLAGTLRMLWATHPDLVPKLVPHHVNKWVDRLNANFPEYSKVRSRDPKK